MPDDESWIELREIGDGERRIDRHVEDAGGQREPRLLKAPEATERVRDPDVKAAFFRQCARELADHQRRGQTPKDGDDQEQQESAFVSSLADKIFQTIGTARDHEIGDGDERDETESSNGRAQGRPSASSFDLWRSGDEIDPAGGDMVCTLSLANIAEII